MKFVDRFCYKHPKFGIPNIMTYLVIGNVAVWFFCIMDRTGTLANFLSLNPKLVLEGQVWRIVTFMFVPQSLSLLEILFFYFYYWIGNLLEREWGTARMNFFLLSGVLLTVIYSLIAYAISGREFYAGTYYIYLSMFFSFATLFPDMRVLFMFFIPIKVKWLALADAIFFAQSVLVCLISGYVAMAFLPIVAVLNYFVFFGGDIVRAIRGNRPKRSATTVNFNREKSRIKYEEREKKYNHKCAVCGRTDTENPGLEFRYCSRCAGYHCFCADHINSHVHFTE